MVSFQVTYKLGESRWITINSNNRFNYPREEERRNIANRLLSGLSWSQSGTSYATMMQKDLPVKKFLKGLIPPSNGKRSTDGTGQLVLIGVDLI